MSLDTYSGLAAAVQARCPVAGLLLARQWVQHALRRVAEKRRWSWLTRTSQAVFPAVVNAGTCTVTHNSDVVTGSGTAWDASMVGRQFRRGTGVPIYDIIEVSSTTNLRLSQVYGGATQSAVGYEIFSAYHTPPSDFHAFISVWDTNFNWQLWTNFYTQLDLNRWDAQRANSGTTYTVIFRDYANDRVGTVGTVIQVDGSGPDPVSTGSYTGAADAVFTLECTLGGASGTATFRWKKDSGSYTSGVLTDTNALDLQDGAQVYWPVGTYVLGDIWVFTVKAGDAPGLPRYEFWPHRKEQYVFPYLYEARVPDLGDTGAVLPRYIRGDVLLEFALAQAARWPGAEGRRNPYFNLALAQQHEAMAQLMTAEMERQDDEVAEFDVVYRIPPGYATFPGDASWLQSHAEMGLGGP